MLMSVANAIAGSALQRGALALLSQIPGFPPVIQTVHILAICAIMGSVVLIDLRVLGLALPSQKTAELTKRLMPYTWWALPLLAISGGVFVFARPQRYAVNPVFMIKFLLMAPAIGLALAFHLATLKDGACWERSAPRRLTAKVIALVSLVLWIGVVMAGRWIAYADYLFSPE
jgi:hypothetical protein